MAICFLLVGYGGRIMLQGSKGWVWTAAVFLLVVNFPSQSQQVSTDHTLMDPLYSAEMDEGAMDSAALPEPLQVATGKGSGGGTPKGEKKAPKKIELTGVWRLRYEAKENFDLIYDRPSVDPGVADNDDDFLLSRLIHSGALHFSGCT